MQASLIQTETEEGGKQPLAGTGRMDGWSKRRLITGSPMAAEGCALDCSMHMAVRNEAVEGT